jgi:hypothetical protein
LRPSSISAVIGRRCRAHVVEQALDRRIDMLPIGRDLVGARTRQQAALGPRVTRAGRDVVGVEQERKIVVEDLIILEMRHQHKLLEEPGRVGAMPFGRTGVRHGLDHLVFGRKQRRAAVRFGAHRAKRGAPTGAFIGDRSGRRNDDMLAGCRATHNHFPGARHITRHIYRHCDAASIRSGTQGRPEGEASLNTP